MAAAVIEFNSLADAVGARAKDDDLGLVGRRRLVLFVISRVKIWRHGLKLGGAGVDELKHGLDVLALAQFPNLLHAFLTLQLPLGGNAFVAEAKTLQSAECIFIYLRGSYTGETLLRKSDFANLVQKPGIH